MEGLTKRNSFQDPHPYSTKEFPGDSEQNDSVEIIYFVAFIARSSEILY